MGDLVAFFAILLSLTSLPLALVALTSNGGYRRRIERLEHDLFHLHRMVAPPPPPGLVMAPPPPGFMPMFPPPPPPELQLSLALGAPAAAVAVPIGPPATGAAPIPLSPPAQEPPPNEAPATFEERVALVWFTRIGALILLLGFGFFFKYATDIGWIGQTGRLLLGTGVGAAVLAGAELARKRTRPLFLHVVSGVGLGVLYLVAWASHVLYGVTSAPVALGGFIAVTLIGGALSVRNRAELVLVFSLVGGFLAPILLSSGADQPLALFAYVVALTGLAFVAAVRLGFRIAPWIAVGGTVVLTLGWMATRFHPHAEYATLASRWPALLGVAAVTAEWLLVAGYARRKALDRVTPMALVLCALVFAHGGAAVLMFDHAPLLGVITALLAGLGASTVLRTMPRGYLAIPMAAATLVLVVARTHHTGAEGLGTTVQTLAGSAVAMAIYGFALLRDQWRDSKLPDTGTLLLASAASAGFTVIAATALLDHHPHAFAVAVVAVSAVQAVLAIAAQRPSLMLLTALAGAVAFGAAAGEAHGQPMRFAAIAAGWTAVFVAAAAWELLVLKLAPVIMRLVTVAFAAFMLPLIAWTAIAHGPLEGALPAVDGIVLAALGAGLLARSRRDALALIAGGLGLVAVAIALPITGASSVMVAAILAGVVVALAANARHGLWLVAGVVLFGLTVVFWLPAEVVSHPLRLAPLANPRAATLAITAAALLGSAYAASRARESWFPSATTLLTIAGHAIVLILLLTETVNLVRDGNTLLMTTTLVLGVYAAALITLGFGARSKLHRYLGLALFAITLLKLALFDVWSLQRVYQMLVLLGVGGLLVVAGFLYARFGRRLVALLRD